MWQENREKDLIEIICDYNTEKESSLGKKFTPENIMNGWIKKVN